VAALHQGAPGQMTWLEDPPPWLRPACLSRALLLISDRWPLYFFYVNNETISASL